MAEITTPVPQAPIVDEPVSEVGQLSQTTLMRLRFTRNKLAMVSLSGFNHHVFIGVLRPFYRSE